MHLKLLKRILRPPVLLCEVCHTWAEPGFWREWDEAWVCRKCWTFPVPVLAEPKMAGKMPTEHNVSCRVRFSTALTNQACCGLRGWQGCKAR